jgi:hypothetical protein
MCDQSAEVWQISLATCRTSYLRTNNQLLSSSLLDGLKLAVEIGNQIFRGDLDELRFLPRNLDKVNNSTVKLKKFRAANNSPTSEKKASCDLN